MIPRYTRPEMGRLWEPANRFQKWLEVEIAVCEAWAEIGEIPKSALKNIKKKAKFNISRIEEIEKTVKHDVIAFLTSVGESVGQDAKYIHKGLTSYDIVDTALSLLMKESADIIIEDIEKLKEVLKNQALKYKNVPCIGRSHGVHAEPMTFGLKFALWYEDTKRSLKRMQTAKQIISVGKISGAVGTFSNLPPIIEETVCRKLGLQPENISTQIIQRDRHAEYLNTLALIASNIEKIAIEIRHLQRTEVLEAEEPFSVGQKGSSAMPHKRNPIGCENLSGLARIVRAYCLAGMENIALWHERDISHSSVERIIIPDSIILVDYMLHRLIDILDGLIIYPEKMLQNMEKSYGLFNSQRVMLNLIEKGLSREKAYELVQQKAMESWGRGINFKELLIKDKKISQYLSTEEIEEIFDLKYYLRNINYIFNRVFNEKE
ncbi:MAG: adenylosuccinate lyase [Thermodesulfovibrionales bacterium]|nr:adenylosuccinate lyase [Thermodesulfovibrionales bacterium]